MDPKDPDSFPYPLLEDPVALACCRGWSEAVYTDLLALQRGELSESAFRSRHLWTRAILVLDMTDFTTSAISAGDMGSLLRILDAQKVVLPVLQEHGASLTHCFADDIFALFEDPSVALDAAIEIQRRVTVFNDSDLASAFPTQCCIGIGYGQVLRIGPDLAQGAEMNMASKLGEDVSRGREILLTENAYRAVSGREDVRFAHHPQDERPFGFYEVEYSL
jgi:class 3 adenylate cyclase